MNDTSAPERKSRGANPLAALSRMLRSTSRNYPNTFLVSTTEGFGVRLADGRSLHVVCNGHWTDQDTRDFLVLFVHFLSADPARIRPRTARLDGVSAEVIERSR